MPEHRFYAEPFAGAASVLLAKPPAPGGEIINDLNGDTINLFRVMQNREQSEELIRRLDWTPYAKAELELSRETSDDPVERARRMVIRSFMGIEVSGVRGTASGFRMGNVDLRRLDQDGVRTFRNTGRDWCNWKEALPAIRDRLADVMIYERDALEFIGLMSAPDALIYIDPPYHIETRTRAHGGSRYAVEFGAEQHAELVAVLLDCPAMVLLSGYPHDCYIPFEKAGWYRVEKDYRANMSTSRRTECLWMNYGPGPLFQRITKNNLTDKQIPVDSSSSTQINTSKPMNQLLLTIFATFLVQFGNALLGQAKSDGPAGKPAAKPPAGKPAAKSTPVVEEPEEETDLTLGGEAAEVDYDELRESTKEYLTTLFAAKPVMKPKVRELLTKFGNVKNIGSVADEHIEAFSAAVRKLK